MDVTDILEVREYYSQTKVNDGKGFREIYTFPTIFTRELENVRCILDIEKEREEDNWI